MTWNELHTAAAAALEPLPVDHIMLDQPDGNDEPVWTDNTAWVAVYAAPACNEGWHVYVDHISADCKDLRVLRLSVAGKTWTAADALKAASIVSRLALAERD